MHITFQPVQCNPLFGCAVVEIPYFVSRTFPKSMFANDWRQFYRSLIRVAKGVRISCYPIGIMWGMGVCSVPNCCQNVSHCQNWIHWRQFLYFIPLDFTRTPSFLTMFYFVSILFLLPCQFLICLLNGVLFAKVFSDPDPTAIAAFGKHWTAVLNRFYNVSESQISAI